MVTKIWNSMCLKPCLRDFTAPYKPAIPSVLTVSNVIMSSNGSNTYSYLLNAPHSVVSSNQTGSSLNKCYRSLLPCPRSGCPCYRNTIPPSLPFTGSSQTYLPLVRQRLLSPVSHIIIWLSVLILLGPSITSPLRELSFVEDLIGLRNAQVLVRLTIGCSGEDVSRES